MKDDIATYHKPFRITIEHHNMKVTVETNHSDLDIQEFSDILVYASRACGWTEDQINKIFNNDNQNR
jgi:hypothetical protein